MWLDGLFRCQKATALGSQLHSGHAVHPSIPHRQGVAGRFALGKQHLQKVAASFHQHILVPADGRNSGVFPAALLISVKRSE
jgi:hypothetical protein